MPETMGYLADPEESGAGESREEWREEVRGEREGERGMRDEPRCSGVWGLGHAPSGKFAGQRPPGKSGYRALYTKPIYMGALYVVPCI